MLYCESSKALWSMFNPCKRALMYWTRMLGLGAINVKSRLRKGLRGYRTLERFFRFRWLPASAQCNEISSLQNADVHWSAQTDRNFADLYYLICFSLLAQQNSKSQANSVCFVPTQLSQPCHSGCALPVIITLI